MTIDISGLNRRRLLAGAVGVALGIAGGAPARADTGIRVLDTKALMVRNPEGVILIAITLTPGSRLVAVGEHGVIIFSDDNGATWRQAAVPVDVTLTCVEFANADIGWAAGHFGAILKTEDGGQSWQLQLNGLQANQLTLQAAQDPSVATNPSPAAQIALLRAQHFMASGPAYPFFTMLIYSPEKVIVFGGYRLTMMTTDGGKTWQDWSLHIYDKFSHNIYDAAFIGGVAYLLGEEGLIFTSTDGGNTFLPQTPAGPTTLFGILNAKDGALVVFGVAGFAARSTDGGKSWALLNVATQQDLTGGCVLKSGVLIMVDEAGTVFASTDDGMTFASLSGIQSAPFFAVEQAPDGGLVAVGGNGVRQIARALLPS